jgi:hypothetical protein
VRNFFLMYPAVEHDDIGDTIEMIISHASSPTMGAINSDTPFVAQFEGGLTINEQLANRPHNIWTGVSSGGKPKPSRRVLFG